MSAFTMLFTPMICFHFKTACGVLNVTGFGTTCLIFSEVVRLCFGFNLGFVMTGLWAQLLSASHHCRGSYDV